MVQVFDIIVIIVLQIYEWSNQSIQTITQQILVTVCMNISVVWLHDTTTYQGGYQLKHLTVTP